MLGICNNIPNVNQTRGKTIMYTVTLTRKQLNALLMATESNIDMYDDMALDPMFLTANQVRVLATKSDEEIRKTFSNNAKETSENIDMLIELQLLYAQLKSL